MGAGFEDVGPDMVEEVDKLVFAAETLDSECEMLDCRGGSLAVHEVSVGECVNEQWDDGIDVGVGCWSDVLEHEGEGFEDAVLDVEFSDSVLIHECRQDGEWPASFRHDGDGDCGAHSQLPFLNLKVVKQCRKHILRPNSFGDVPECVDSRSADTFLVRFQQVQQVETNADPLFRHYMFRASVCNPSDQIDAILLHFLMPVLQDRRQSRQQVLNRWRHLAHPDNVHDSFKSSQDGP